MLCRKQPIGVMELRCLHGSGIGKKGNVQLESRQNRLLQKLKTAGQLIFIGPANGSGLKQQNQFVCP